jgi:hypothetical protein
VPRLTLFAASLCNNRGDRLLPPSLGMSKRREAVLICKVGVCATGQYQFCCLLVAQTAVSKDNDLEEAGSAEAVDVIDIDFS